MLHENDYFDFAVWVSDHGFPDHEDCFYGLRWVCAGDEDGCEPAIGHWTGVCGWEEDCYGDGGGGEGDVLCE